MIIIKNITIIFFFTKIIITDSLAINPIKGGRPPNDRIFIAATYLFNVESEQEKIWLIL